MHATLDSFTLTAGRPDPLGATLDGDGVNFALFSANADAVDLCLFSGTDDGEQRVRLPARTGDIWHGHVAGLKPGQRYGYRVHGPYNPPAGHRFNPAKLLIDPYARVLDGRVADHPSVLGYRPGGPDADLAIDGADSAFAVPKAVVTIAGDNRSDGGTGPRPNRPLSETIIYEAHIRGATMRLPSVPDDIRGTFAGLASEPMLDHILSLGVTAVEVLPVHAFYDDRFLTAAGLVNYWGYNSIAFFAPDRRYAGPGATDPVAAFRAMVRRLHHAGLEVILDVVYNHTGEGGHLGSALTFRGIDNASYYRLMPDDKRHYVNDTGTGNTLNMDHPQVRRLVLDSLRYGASDMGVDGFRFDLASTLARRADGFDPNHPFLTELVSDPVLSRVKLIAEPWDIGPGGYRLGGFPPPFAEWNDRFRDTMRRFWRGDDGVAAEFATRFAGSADIFDTHGRSAASSLNFVTAHDGFTLADLVAYAHKHNEANSEDNRDGHGGNNSTNHGVEGNTDDPRILSARARHKRNLLACLFLAQGTPMLLAGDEAGNSQNGNNNAYCQDNEIGWIDWRGLTGEGGGKEFLAFVRRLISFRRDHCVLRQTGFLHSRPRRSDGLPDLAYGRPDGNSPTPEDWHNPRFRQFSVTFRQAAEADTASGGGTPGESAPAAVLVLINRAGRGADFVAPPARRNHLWSARIDTARADGKPGTAVAGIAGGGTIHVAANSLVALAECPAEEIVPGS